MSPLASDHALVSDFARELDLLRERCAGDPRAELDHLWRLGLEREQIVTVAYRRDIIEDRLERMPLDPALAALVSRAIRWAWRDERMHALWARGALLRYGERLDAPRTVFTQIEGHVAGWLSSRQHHNRWTERPLTRLGAELLELAGAFAGRIPGAVRKELHYAPFRDVCRFNVAAEMTACMAWSRMAALAQDAGIPDEDALAFTRMAEDEDRHARMFAVLAAAFDAEDRLVVEAARLREDLEAIGQRFVALPSPDRPAWRNPLGKGAVVHVREASRAEQGPRLLTDLVEQTLGPRLEAFEAPRVAIKAAFLLAVRREDPSPHVSLDLLRALVAWLEARGARVTVIEARNLYGRFHANRDVLGVARWLGIGDLPIADAQIETAPHAFERGLGQDRVARSWKEADLRIVFGKLRGHPTGAMGALDACDGLGHPHDAFAFTARKTDRETATMMILDAFPPDLAILDAFTDVPDGLLGMMGIPDPRQPLRLYASADAVSLDAVIARHLDLRVDDESFLGAAFDWFGDPTMRLMVDGPNTPLPGWRRPDHTRRTALLARLSMPVFHHASQQGALFVPPMDEGAFPPLAPPSPAMRAAREVVWALVAGSPRAAPPEAPGLLTTGWCTVAGRAVRVARLGSGPPVVLLHGYPDNLRIWSRVAEGLALHHEVIAFDWPGLGYSEAWEGPLDPVALATRVERILDALDLDRVAVVGMDMGGPPALCLAAARPERVAAVGVLNSLLFGDGPTSWEIAVMRRSGLARAAFGWMAGTVYQRCKATFLRGAPLPEALDADLAGAFLHPEVRETVTVMCAAYERALPDLPQKYWQVRAPVLALWAEEDGHFPPGHAKRLASLVPGARSIVLPGALHWMAWTDAPAVVDHLRPFLEDAWMS